MPASVQQNKVFRIEPSTIYYDRYSTFTFIYNIIYFVTCNQKNLGVSNFVVGYHNDIKQ